MGSAILNLFTRHPLLEFAQQANNNRECIVYIHNFINITKISSRGVFESTIFDKIIGYGKIGLSLTSDIYLWGDDMGCCVIFYIFSSFLVN